jgi:hypothetical protein
MLWFFEGFFPVLWLAFILYWRIKADGDRALCRGSSPHLHRHPDRASWHRDCALRGARIDLSRPGIPRDLAQATVGGGVDAFAIWRDVYRVRPTHSSPGALPFLT